MVMGVGWVGETRSGSELFGLGLCLNNGGAAIDGKDFGLFEE